ncbi:MAG: LysM peptidoglycan-binding domain-containing protein [Phycisphaerae bacterium]
MSLNVKLALVISVGFITGMCWLVNRAGRPLIEEPSPLHVPGGAAPGSPRGALSAQPATPGASLFRRPSPVEPPRMPSAAESLPLAVATPVAVVSERPREHVALPPFLASSRQPAAGSDASDAPDRNSIGERRLPPSLAALGDSARTPAGANPTSASPVSTPLTPELARSTPPPARGNDAPPPMAVANVAPTDEAPAVAPPPNQRRYTVQRGDSLAAIARREWSGRDEDGVKLLMAANPQLGGRADRIYVGEEIVIPISSSSAVPPRDVAATSDRAPSRTAADRAPASRATEVSTGRAMASNRDTVYDTPPDRAAAGPRERDAGRSVPEVERNDTRKAPAREGAAPAAEPRKRSPAAPRMRPGETEERRVASAAAPSRGSLTAKKPTPAERKVAASDRKAGAAEAKSATRVYTVKAADSLKSIAARELNDARRWREIARLNGVKDPNRVLAGAKLRLPAGDRVAQR